MTNVIPLVDISVQPIELCKLLKIANMVGGGGEAKIVISEGYVLLNNEVEFQKRKKVRHDDIVEFNGETVQVNFVPANKNKSAKNTKSATTKSSTAKSTNKAKKNNNPAPTQAIDSPRSKRKPISF
ncbi:MAG: RNA-binding S4 domain-containing protein [Cognaticolwellia sp.]